MNKASFPFWAVRANGQVYGCNLRAEAVRKAGRGGEVRVVNPQSDIFGHTPKNVKLPNGYEWELGVNGSYNLFDPQRILVATLEKGNHGWFAIWDLIAEGKGFKHVRGTKRECEQAIAKIAIDAKRVANPHRKRNPPHRLPFAFGQAQAYKTPESTADTWYISKDWSGMHKSWRDRGTALRAAGPRGTVFESDTAVGPSGKPREAAPTWTSGPAVNLAAVQNARLANHASVQAAQNATAAAKKAATAAHEAEYRAREAERAQREAAQATAQIMAREMLKTTHAAEHALVEAAKTAAADADRSVNIAKAAEQAAREAGHRASQAETRLSKAERSIHALRAQEARAMITPRNEYQVGNLRPMGSDIPREQQFANLEID